jgi:hypothetical protein
MHDTTVLGRLFPPRSTRRSRDDGALVVWLREGVFAKLSARRRLETARCTCPKEEAGDCEVLEVGVGSVLKYIFFLIYYELLLFELGLQYTGGY